MEGELSPPAKTKGGGETVFKRPAIKLQGSNCLVLYGAARTNVLIHTYRNVYPSE